MFLEKSNFECVIRFAPLVSIDLVVKNRKGEILLGLRKNEPAKGLWFVPGGRIFKDETIDNAFKRISENELGIEYNISQSKFLGLYEHFYDNNAFNDDFSTHYIVMGFEISLEDVPKGMKAQHEAYRWFDVETLLADPMVHRYTKNYFLDGKGIR
ncbi:GDP-mannose mannosyl hydrolase [Hydrogenimonas cancrithermarum]|uniref:GDP-mannose mannosyl hydrolase NudD n=1 Tax=Hydrogenimonas cancrithermarum TaxID=2993563 RepID=A0ABN6WYS1_9BACT|nr:GDP-mannose mannosyl hydrolase [Hydrogenimonas cancrithermarum]BDY13410.1 GDP-mannose mannosyl hydrolase NudD [Hydrogenimonas cancrithermarum]